MSDRDDDGTGVCMMFLFGKSKRKKKTELENLCHLCGVNQMPEEPAILRLKVEGDHIVEIQACDECADFFEKSADILCKGKSNEQSV